MAVHRINKTTSNQVTLMVGESIRVQIQVGGIQFRVDQESKRSNGQGRSKRANKAANRNPKDYRGTHAMTKRSE